MSVLKYFDKVNNVWRKVAGSGGSGTDDYLNLANKPKINGVTLAGNKSPEDLGLDMLYAPLEHSHSASDIVSGIVPVSRGGTGAGSFEPGAVIANGANDFTSRAITDQESGALTPSTNLVTAKSVVAHVNSKKMYQVAVDSIGLDPNLLWIDTTADTGGLKYHNGSAWVAVPTRWV